MSEGDEEKGTRGPVFTLETAFGSIPALPGVDEGDFDDLIEEAMKEHADAVVARMKEGAE